MNKNFDKDASIWCTECGEGDTIVVYFESLHEVTIPVLDMDGNEDEDGRQTIGSRSRQDETYRCEFCEVESDELDEIATDQLWVAYGAWAKRHKIDPETHEQIGVDDGEDDE